MIPKAVAWIVGIVFFAGAIFMEPLYWILGSFGTGALALLVLVGAIPAWGLAPDKVSRIVLMVGLLSFLGVRSWDLTFGAGSYPWTADPPGDAESFTPIASYTAVRDFVHAEAQLVSLRARQVRSDGTIDVTACELHTPCVEYAFLAPRRYPVAESPAGAPQAASPGAHLYEVHLHRESDRHPSDLTSDDPDLEGHPWPYGWGWSRGMWRHHKGAKKKPPGVLPDPTCRFAELWKQATAAGQPKDAEAEITYDERGYHLRIGEDVHLRYGRDCELKAVVRLEYASGGHRGLRPELFIDGESAGILKWVYNQGNTRELWLSPGEHTFRATLERQPERRATVRLVAGEYRRVELERQRRRSRDDD